MTKRDYDHFLRKEFSPGLRSGLGIESKDESAKVIPIKPVAQAAKQRKKRLKPAS